MLILYSIAIFLSAALLFLVQPLFARMLLPSLGGAPSVWNVALVFYQAILLAGYSYAHWSTNRLGVRRQCQVHLAILFLPLLLLPIALPADWTPPTDHSPIPWLLGVLLTCVGLPFFVVSASGPLLQRWFATTGHRFGKDPYFLYASSNLGSFLGLAMYPVWFEPKFALAHQSKIWAIGYGIFVVLAIACGVTVLRSQTSSTAFASNGDSTIENQSPPTWRSRLRWIILAFVPCGLMLGATTHLTTGLAPIPLLWVIPLGVYLLTFTLAFARRPLLPHWLMVRALPFVVLPLVIVLASSGNGPLWAMISMHLAALFVIGMVCHGEIARNRPPVRYLTEFYLWVSVGGVMGGLFCALVAPVIFSSVAEYPLVLIMACLLAPSATDGSRTTAFSKLDVLLPACLGLVTLGLVLAFRGTHAETDRLGVALMFSLPALVCFGFSRRPLRFGLGVAAILLASFFHRGAAGELLHAERSFFGVHRVVMDATGKYRLLMNGTTIHGKQSIDPLRRMEPLSYYTRSGPLGQVLTAWEHSRRFHRVAVVGLGTGSIICYGAPEQEWTFYEIDPAVERIVRDERYFSLLRDALPKTHVVLGDARLSLARAIGERYDLMILDAYSSGSIPIHLLTREALRVYLDRLSDEGILLFHISHHYLDLEPIVGNLAGEAGLVCLVQDEHAVSSEESARGKQPSRWAVMARSTERLGAVAGDKRWIPARTRPDIRPWTDDHSSVFDVFRSRQ